MPHACTRPPVREGKPRRFVCRGSSPSLAAQHTRQRWWTRLHFRMCACRLGTPGRRLQRRCRTRYRCGRCQLRRLSQWRCRAQVRCWPSRCSRATRLPGRSTGRLGQRGQGEGEYAVDDPAAAWTVGRGRVWRRVCVTCVLQGATYQPQTVRIHVAGAHAPPKKRTCAGERACCAHGARLRGPPLWALVTVAVADSSLVGALSAWDCATA